MRGNPGMSANGIDRAIKQVEGVDILTYCCTQLPQVISNRVLCTCTVGIVEHRVWV